MPKRSDFEQKALRFISNNGEKGVLQSQLWRQLDASSREGSRVAIKLEHRGLIRRERELRQGRWTYRLYPKRKAASINSIINSPCLTCSETIRCGAYGEVSPNDCDKLTGWIVDLTQKDGEQGEPDKLAQDMVEKTEA